LTLAAPVVGTPEDRLADHAECGSLACQSILRLADATVVMPIEDNSSAGMLAGGVAKVLPIARTSIASGNLADVVAAAIPQGHYVVGLVHCTGNAVPKPPPATAAHWVAIYDVDGRYYQCWTASYQPGFDMRACSDGTGPHLVIDLSEVDTMSAAAEQQIADLHAAVFQPVAINGGTSLETTPPNNIDIIRRAVSPYNAGYPPANGIPAVAGTGLSAAQSAALAQIPAIAAALASGDLTLAHIEAALKGA
jgi:hypothetical protein